MRKYSAEHGLHLPTVVFETPQSLAAFAAKELADLINEHTRNGAWINLGLATGSSPVLLYRELLALHHAGQVSFTHVRIFMLDEYFGIARDNALSFYTFIDKILLQHLNDFNREHFYIPNGEISASAVAQHAQEYERLIAEFGGIHYQLLGVGRDGHIGFNEPETEFDSRTGLRTLHRTTRLDAASDFFGLENVPTEGVSMGIGTILEASTIRLVACNEGKAATIKALLEQDENIMLPASALHRHPSTTVYLDSAAASELHIEKYPWEKTAEVAWDAQMLERLITRQAELQQTTISGLNDEYFAAEIEALKASNVLDSDADIRSVAHEVISSRLADCPGANPGETVIVFSPHPDDAEIQCGGTIQRLLASGVRVVVAVMTSGRIAVWDRCAKPIVNDSQVLAEWLSISEDVARAKRPDLLREISRSRREPGEKDSLELREIKGAIRRNEAFRGITHLGVAPGDVRFLELPFYETDAIEKAPPTAADHEAVVKLLKELKPSQVYAAGDLSDPHGTHRTCLDIVLKAIHLARDRGISELDGIFLYRGAWAEWPLYEMDVIVPISEPELQKALAAMRKHESQIPEALFPGSDPRPFDQRAKERKCAAGKLLCDLGIAQVHAAEGFHFQSI